MGLVRNRSWSTALLIAWPIALACWKGPNGAPDGGDGALTGTAFAILVPGLSGSHLGAHPRGSPRRAILTVQTNGRATVPCEWTGRWTAARAVMARIRDGLPQDRVRWTNGKAALSVRTRRWAGLMAGGMMGPTTLTATTFRMRLSQSLHPEPLPMATHPSGKVRHSRARMLLGQWNQANTDVFSRSTNTLKPHSQDTYHQTDTANRPARSGPSRSQDLSGQQPE